MVAADNPAPEKRSPAFAGLIGRLLACLWRSVSALLVVVFVRSLTSRLLKKRASLVPEESDGDFAVECPQRGPVRCKTPVWAICHVGQGAPPVKIFDTRSRVVRDITFHHPVDFF